MRLIDITKTIEAGMNEPLGIIIEETEHTYPYKEVVEDNWLYAETRGLAKLRELILTEMEKGERLFPTYYADIGTGSGVVAISAKKIFPELEKVCVTDLDINQVKLAVKNFVRNLGREPNSKGESVITGSAGSLCNPLNGIKFDIITENLPNISEEAANLEGYRAGSVYDAKDMTVSSEEFKKIKENIDSYLLRSHAAFLFSARNNLHKGGSALLSVGARVPYKMYEEIFNAAGYQWQPENELVVAIKKQTEPWEVFPGYATAEQNGVKFDFYHPLELAIETLREKGLMKADEQIINTPSNIAKEEIAKYHINATEANRLYERGVENIGHLVSILRATKEI